MLKRDCIYIYVQIFLLFMCLWLIPWCALHRCKYRILRNVYKNFTINLIIPTVLINCFPHSRKSFIFELVILCLLVLPPPPYGWTSFYFLNFIFDFNPGLPDVSVFWQFLSFGVSCPEILQFIARKFF